MEILKGNARSKYSVVLMQKVWAFGSCCYQIVVALSWMGICDMQEWQNYSDALLSHCICYSEAFENVRLLAFSDFGTDVLTLL